MPRWIDRSVSGRTCFFPKARVAMGWRICGEGALASMGEGGTAVCPAGAFSFPLRETRSRSRFNSTKHGFNMCDKNKMKRGGRICWVVFF